LFATHNDESFNEKLSGQELYTGGYTTSLFDNDIKYPITANVNIRKIIVPKISVL